MYRYTDGGAYYEDITPPDMYIDQIRHLSVIQQGENDGIIAIGYGPHYWQIAYSADNGSHWEEIQTPPGFINMAEFTNQIRDVTIMKIESDRPVFVIATDLGIFEYGSDDEWTHIYDNSGDNDVYSVAFKASETNPEIYAGTLHSLISIDDENNFHRVNNAMFTTDLKSTWVPSGNQGCGYTLNTRTGAIFKINLNFDNFVPNSGQISIGADTIVANISGTEGEFNGLDLAGYHNPNNSAELIIASSKNADGTGKIIRKDDRGWREGFVPGNVPLMKLGVIIDEFGTKCYGITASGQVYRSFDGDSWEWYGHFEAENINDLLVASGHNLAVAVVGSNTGKILRSTNGGTDWDPCDNGLQAVSQVMKITRGNDEYYYAATDAGVYKNPDIFSQNSSWTLKNEELPAGSYYDILPGSKYYYLMEDPPDHPYDCRWVVYALKSELNQDRFFISADSARSWIEDSSFPSGSSFKIKRLFNFDYYGTGIIPQTGILAATDKGLLYHPHNVLNGEYKSIGQYNIITWGPGLIIVNGYVYSEPSYIDPDTWIWSRIDITQGTALKFTYKFNIGFETQSGIRICGYIRSYYDDNYPDSLNYFVSSRTPPFSNDWAGLSAVETTYVDPNLVAHAFYPHINLRGCIIQNAAVGISGQSCEYLTVKRSEISECNETGISVNNTAPPVGDQTFNVHIDSCAIFDNPNYDIYINAYGTSEDCDWQPWNGEDPPTSPGSIWDPHGGQDPDKHEPPQKPPCE